jgi:hypothetical protein
MSEIEGVISKVNVQLITIVLYLWLYYYRNGWRTFKLEGEFTPRRKG